MGKKWFLSLSLVVLSGCAQFPDLGQAISALYPRKGDPEKEQGVQGPFNFDWALSGDRTIAPLQVFDNGVKTWLQFPVGAPVPAVFARSGAESGGVFPVQPDRLLALVQQGDYVVVNEVPDQLVFRGGHLQAAARRGRPVATGSGPSEPAVPLAVVVQPENTVAGNPSPLPFHPGPVRLESPLDIGSDSQNPTLPDVVAMNPEPARFSVDRADGNLRQVLMRWAGTSGWDFGPEHWVVDVDIPIIGAATFDLPFVEAVRALVSSTELAERPLQPCFYSNRVLRVVPYTQPCNRTAGAMVSA